MAGQRKDAEERKGLGGLFDAKVHYSDKRVIFYKIRIISNASF